MNNIPKETRYKLNDFRIYYWNRIYAINRSIKSRQCFYWNDSSMDLCFRFFFFFFVFCCCWVCLFFVFAFAFVLFCLIFFNYQIMFIKSVIRSNELINLIQMMVSCDAFIKIYKCILWLLLNNCWGNMWVLHIRLYILNMKGDRLSRSR